jgi:hypothetical protein
MTTRQPTFDENGHVVITRQDELELIRKVMAYELPEKVKDELELKSIFERWPLNKYRAVKFTTKLNHFLTTIIEEDEEEIQLLSDLARFEGEGGLYDRIG